MYKFQFLAHFPFPFKFNIGRIWAIIRYIGQIWDGRQKVKSLIVWDFPDIWKPGFKHHLFLSRQIFLSLPISHIVSLEGSGPGEWCCITGSRPWDKGGAGGRSSGSLERGGGRSPKKMFFGPSGLSLVLKEGQGADPPRVPPLDPPLCCILNVFLSWKCRTHKLHFIIVKEFQNSGQRINFPVDFFVMVTVRYRLHCSVDLVCQTFAICAWSCNPATYGPGLTGPFAVQLFVPVIHQYVYS